MLPLGGLQVRARPEPRTTRYRADPDNRVIDRAINRTTDRTIET